MSVIDRLTLENLRTLGDAVVLQLTEAFSNNAPARIEQVRSGLASGDLEAVRRSCHSLKSTAAAVGGLPLAETARRIEAAASAGRVAEVQELVPELEGCFDLTLLELRQYIDEAAGGIP